MNSDCYRRRLLLFGYRGRIHQRNRLAGGRPSVRGPGFEIWYGRRQRLNPARGKGAMSSDSAGDCLQLSPAENPCRRCRFGISIRQDPVDPFARAVPVVRIRFPPADSPSLTGNSVPRSRTPAFRAGVRAMGGGAVGRDGDRPVAWRLLATMSLLGQIPVPQCR